MWLHTNKTSLSPHAIEMGRVTLNENLEKFIELEIQSVKGKRMNAHSCSPAWTTVANSVPSI